jgi:hypothetical protein
VAKDASLELRQLIQRGFDHHEHARYHDALSDWETALKLDRRNVQAKRLVEFAKVRAAEVEAGQHTPPSRRDTLESPIPQFLAALTERKSDKITVADRETAAVEAVIDDHTTPEHDLRVESQAREGGERGERFRFQPEGASAADTLEDLPVHAEDIRASANELVGECRTALGENRAGPAALAAELALQLSERAPPPGVDDVIDPSRALFERAFRAFMGNPLACPIRAIPTETLGDHGLDQQAAFLMSRMDAMTSLADLIDSSGIKHFDAVRLVAALRRAKAIDILPPLQ